MIYIFPEKLLSFKIKLSDIFIHSFLCGEVTLQLNLPKLIDELHFVSSNSVGNTLSNVFNKKQNDLYKFDKKYQQNNYSVDNVDIKKVKSRSIKKKRIPSSTIINKDIFSDNQEDLLNQSSLSLPELKLRKLNNKTKRKNKANIYNLNVINNTINTTNKIEVKSSGSNKTNNRVVINDPLTVHELSLNLNIPEAEIITYLFLNKTIAATVNQLLDTHIAKEVAEHYHFIVTNLKDSNKILINSRRHTSSSCDSARSPVITILGHVDHGKTTLLDSILKTNLVYNEFGGITQRMSAYETSWIYQSYNYDLVFLDTPGHQSFKAMRLIGARITDIVLLIISIDDGIQPQTIEAINYIKELDITCIVVVTKVDKSDQNIDFILNDLANYDIVTEKWGGETPVIQVSAITNRNIDALLSKICMLCSIKNFTANIEQLAMGVIIDSYLDKKQGPVASILVQDGILRIGNVIASGNIYGKVKKITNLSSQPIVLASPSSIVQVLGFSEIPIAGLDFKSFVNEKQAKQFCLNYSYKGSKMSNLKTLNSRIVQNYSDNFKHFKLIIKADTQGSLEAIIDLLSTISQLKVQLRIISASFTGISNSDLDLAANTGASVVSFNLDLTSGVINNIKKYNIVFKTFNIIYDLFEYVKTCMLDLIEPEYDRVFIGRAIVRTIFNINKGCVAGCYVTEGKLLKSSYLCVYRKDNLVYEGVLSSLKRLKTDVNEVLVNNECGVMCEYNLWKENDYIDVYNLIPQQKIL